MEQLGEMLKEADMVVAVYDVTKTESFGNVAKVVNVLTTFCRLSFKRLFLIFNAGKIKSHKMAAAKNCSLLLGNSNWRLLFLHDCLVLKTINLLAVAH